MKKILLDTNILIYASFEESGFYHEARRTIQEGLKNKDRFFITQSVLLEYYRNLTSKAFSAYLKHEEAMEFFRFYLYSEDFEVLYPSKESSFILENILSPEVKSGRIYDISIASIMLEHGIKTIYTKNVRDFGGIEGIEVLDPL